MKKQIVVAVLASLIPISAFAALTYTPPTPAPGFYMGNHHISVPDVQSVVNKHGAAGIRFVPPAGPVPVQAVCDGVWYRYTYYPHPKNKSQEWQDANGQAMAERLISDCK